MKWRWNRWRTGTKLLRVLSSSNQHRCWLLNSPVSRTVVHNISFQSSSSSYWQTSSYPLQKCCGWFCAHQVCWFWGVLRTVLSSGHIVLPPRCAVLHSTTCALHQRGPVYETGNSLWVCLFHMCLSWEVRQRGGSSGLLMKARCLLACCVEGLLLRSYQNRSPMSTVRERDVDRAG